MSIQILQFEPIAIGYWGVFAVVALACFAGIGRARDIEHTAVQYGAIGLLATTGAWSSLKVVYFLAPDPFREPAYTVGLVFGFATVWAWLYFCSAYTGRQYHRDQTIRKLSASVFTAVVAVKLTNPLHGYYFETSLETTPFEHLAIQHGVFHWTVTGLSYTLAAIGLFMLFELYLNSGYDTRSLGVLTVLLGVPVTLDILALFTDSLIDIIYAPLGVAVFALGVLFVYERRFLAVQSSGSDDDAAVFLDEKNRIRDYSPAASELFPSLDGAEGTDLTEALPDASQIQDRETQIFEYDSDGETRYLLTSRSSVTLGSSEGTVLLFSDVTNAEQRRRELQRHNEQLEGFANALAHELRNMLQIIEWRLGIVADRTEAGTVKHESVEKASDANERLTARVDDFTTLAKYGQTVERLESVAFETAVEDAWWNADTDGMELSVTNGGTIQADPGRLRELLVNVFDFARLNDAETVTVELIESGFTVTDDGTPPENGTEGYLVFGESIPTAEAGMKLPNAKTFAHVHNWEIGVDSDYGDGVRVVVSEATTERDSVTQTATPSGDADQFEDGKQHIAVGKGDEKPEKQRDEKRDTR